MIAAKCANCGKTVAGTSYQREECSIDDRLFACSRECAEEWCRKQGADFEWVDPEK